MMSKPPRGTRCAYCRHRPAWCYDHVVPLSRGGPDRADNLVPACNACNSSKNSQLPSEWPRFEADRHGHVLDIEMRIRAEFEVTNDLSRWSGGRLAFCARRNPRVWRELSLDDIRRADAAGLDIHAYARVLAEHRDRNAVTRLLRSLSPEE